jgi:hypothetical protein
VDGELANVDRYLQIRGSEEVYVIQVACWNPRDSTFSVMGPGLPYYEVLTNAFIEKITSRLVEVEQAQNAFRASRGRFGAELGELGLDHLQADGV